MKQKLIYIAVAVSFFCNVVFMAVFLMDKVYGDGSSDTPEQKDDLFADPIKRKQQAELIIKKLVCDQLYYPNTYDPVSTEVDSAFYGPLLDGDCIVAACDIINLKKEYASAKSSYEHNDWTIRFHGNPSGPFLENERKARKESSEKMTELEKKIAEKESIIKNRDDSHDGEFAGWWAVHKYRAANGSGQVSFSYWGFLLNKDMSNYIIRHDLNDNSDANLAAIKNIIEPLLLSNEEN